MCSCQVCHVRAIEADASLVCGGQRHPTAALVAELLDILAQRSARRAMGKQSRWAGRYCLACNRPLQQRRLGRPRIYCDDTCYARYRAAQRRGEGAMAARRLAEQAAEVEQAIQAMADVPQWPRK